MVKYFDHSHSIRIVNNPFVLKFKLKAVPQSKTNVVWTNRNLLSKLYNTN